MESEPNVEVDVETKKDQLKKSTFSVIFSSRHNNSIPRMEAIDAIAKQVSPDFHKVDLGDPRVAFTCDLIKGCCVLGVAKEWKKFSKYNARILGQNQIQKKHMFIEKWGCPKCTYQNPPTRYRRKIDSFHLLKDQNVVARSVFMLLWIRGDILG